MRLARFLVSAGAAAAAYVAVTRMRERTTIIDWADTPHGDVPSPIADAWAESAATVELGHARTARPREEVESGAFAMRGWAAAAGHAVVSGITFRRRLAADVAPSDIEIEVETTDNVPDSGLLILRDGGFAPSREGFALMLAAAGAGPFSASGTYRVYGPHPSW